MALDDATLEERTRALFRASIETKETLLQGDHVRILRRMARAIAGSIEGGGKLLLCGNGGSAADAQHLATEMLIRLRSEVNREGLPAQTLAQDTSTLTACGNDYGFERVFARTLEAVGRPGDVLIGITTSGKSPNVLAALREARNRGIAPFGFLGAGGGPALELCDEAFVVPSDDTGRIQESHITAGHALIAMVEDLLLDSGHTRLVEDRPYRVSPAPAPGGSPRR